MRKLLLPILLGMFLGTSAAQVITQGLQYVVIAPLGTCLSTNPAQILITTGVIYTCQNVINNVGTWAAATSGGGSGPGTVSSVAATVPTGFSVNGSPVTTSGTLAITTTGLTTNLLQKAISGGLGNSQVTDDGTNPTASPLGFDVSTTGSYDFQIVNNASTGTVLNKTVCDDGTGKGIVCPHATSTTNAVLGFCISGCGTTGNARVSMLGWPSVIYDNQSTARHYAINSTTVDGDLHDSGAGTLTAGQPNFFVFTANAGAGTAGTVRMLIADDFVQASPTAIYKLQVNGTGLTAGDTVNLNGTTPAVPSNGYAITLATSKTGTTDSVSGALVGDGTATHFLNGIGTFTSPSGGGLQTELWTNNATGTGLNLIAKMNAVNANDATITTMTTTDAGASQAIGIVGIVQSGNGTSGNATVAIQGPANCVFDDPTTAGDYVIPSIITNGQCHDGGTYVSVWNTKLCLGRVETTNAGAGTYVVDMGAAFCQINVGGNTNIAWFPAYYGATNIPIWKQSTGIDLGTTGFPLSLFGTSFLRAHNSNNNNQYVDIGVFGDGNSTADFEIKGGSTSNSNDAATRIVGSLYSVLYAPSATSGTIHLLPWQGNSQNITINGATTVGAFNGANQLPNAGGWWFYRVCQDGTGGRTWNWSNTVNWGNATAIGAKLGTCTGQLFMDNDNGSTEIPMAPAMPITAVATSQAAAISATTLATPQTAGMFRVTATLDCDSSSAAATVNETIRWTDPSNTAQSASLGSAVVCTTLGSASIGALTTSFRIKANTNITYETSIVNTPTYDLSVALETLTP